MALSVGDIQGKEKTWRPESVSKGCPQDSRHCGYWALEEKRGQEGTEQRLEQAEEGQLQRRVKMW